MRVLHCSDFHAKEEWYQWLIRKSPRYDLVCLTGDLLDLNPYRAMVGQVEIVTEYLARVRVPFAVCSGNHDSVAGDNPRLQHAQWMQELPRPNVWIDGDRFQLGGFKFRCVPWLSPQVEAAPDEIWLTHSPPDKAWTGIARGGADFGDEVLGARCREGAGPHLALSGHVHEAKSWWDIFGRTWSLNPGHNEVATVPRHIVIDLNRKWATWHGGPRGPKEMPLN